jgi:hypothetical protein
MVLPSSPFFTASSSSLSGLTLWFCAMVCIEPGFEFACKVFVKILVRRKLLESGQT